MTEIPDRSPERGPVTRSEAHMPSDVTDEIAFFDRFAGRAAGVFSRAPYFAFCVAVVLLWLPSYFLIGNGHEWQLLIHTVTTIITFLMVAILQNSEWRSDAAIQGKLNAIADAVAELMEAHSADSAELRKATQELRVAVGIEEVESS